MKRVFLISKHPDIDHLSAFIFFNQNSSTNYIVASENDIQLNHYILKSLFKKKIAFRVNRLNIKNYPKPCWIYCFLLKRYSRAILKRFLDTKNFNKTITFMEKKLEVNLNSRLSNLLKGAYFYMDHRNSNRKQDYFINKLISNSKRIISLPHSYQFASNNLKYEKALNSYKSCIADDIYFYGPTHKQSILPFLSEGLNIKYLKKYKYEKEWAIFKTLSFKEDLWNKTKYLALKNFEESQTIVFLDTPFFENQKLSIKRENLISKISKKYKVIVVPHPRSGKISFNRKNYFIWDGEISILLEKYYRFVGIFTTLSVDIIQRSKLYITCSFLRTPGYYCLDEEFKATKRANSENDVLHLLETQPNIEGQKMFLEEIDVKLLN